MTDREAELRQLVAELRKHEAVDDAFLAKSFTDRLVIVDIGDGEGSTRGPRRPRPRRNVRDRRWRVVRRRRG